MNKEKTLNKYGEYGVPYKITKQLDCFKITWNTPYKEAKKIITELEINGVASEKFYNMDAICVMEFGNIDIEFMSYGVDVNNKFDAGFYCCVNFENDGWESAGFSDLIFNLTMLEDKDKLEEIMYNSMMDYSKKYNLYWSRENYNKKNKLNN